MLNTSRGPRRVRGARTTRRRIARGLPPGSGHGGIDVHAGTVGRLLTEEVAGRRVVRGVTLPPGGGPSTPGRRAIRPIRRRRRSTRRSSGPTVVLTTGTFMRALMHVGPTRTEGGRIGEGSAVGIAGMLRELGFELGRLKTGTPPRLSRASLDWDALPPQRGDERPVPFSDLTDPATFPRLEQVECRLTETTEAIHGLVRDHLHLAPMFSAAEAEAGPRYCPSLEDKVVRRSIEPSVSSSRRRSAATRSTATGSRRRFRGGSGAAGPGWPGASGPRCSSPDTRSRRHGATASDRRDRGDQAGNDCSSPARSTARAGTRRPVVRGRRD